MVSFVKNNLTKVLATLLVSAFFIFFWLNGPLQVKEILAQLEIEETEFSTPIFVGENPEIDYHKVGTVGDVETKGDGWTLLQSKKETKPEGGVLRFDNEGPVYSEEYAQKLVNHAIKIFDFKFTHTVIATENQVYLELKTLEKIYFYTETGPLVSHVRGYAGPINLGVLINQKGQIEQVQHISSKETQSYLDDISRAGFYQSFHEIPIENSHQIDAVSGATLTSQAIAKTTSLLLEQVTSDYQDYLDTERNSASFDISAVNTLWWLLDIFVIGLMFLYGMQKKVKKSKRGIQILSISSVLYIGFFMNGSFTYVSFIHPFVGTSVSGLVAFYALFSLLGAIWGKNTYCKYVCPFGHAQRLSLQLSQKRFSSPFFIPNKWIKRIRLMLAIILVSGILLGLRSWSNFEVFPDFFGMEFLSTWFVIATVIILINLKYPFIWCRLACPTGAVLDGISDLCKIKA